MRGQWSLGEEEKEIPLGEAERLHWLSHVWEEREQLVRLFTK
jgi:hypothetical protein